MKKFVMFFVIIGLLGCSNDSNDSAIDESLESQFNSVYPLQAFEYDILTISGQNIDTMATYTVFINDTEATVIDISETMLKVQIVEGTEDGPLRIELGSNEVQLDQIDILRTEEAKVYAVKNNGPTLSNYIFEIDINTGKTLDTLLVVPNSQYQIIDIEYLKEQNLLVCMDQSGMKLATFNLTTSSFNILPATNPYDGSGITIGEDGRVFAYSYLGTRIWELDLSTGEPIGDAFYISSLALSIEGIYYAETQNKLLVYEFIEETPISSAYTIEKTYNFNDNTISNGAIGLHRNVHVNANEMYSYNKFLLGKRTIGEMIQNPAEMPVNTFNKLRYSNSSNRIFFYYSDSQSGYIDYIYRYHIPTQSFNNVAIEEDIRYIVVAN